jgi:hypothetical protein
MNARIVSASLFAALLCGGAAAYSGLRTICATRQEQPSDPRAQSEPEPVDFLQMVKVPRAPLSIDFSTGSYSMTISGTPVLPAEAEAASRVIVEELRRYPPDTIVSNEAGSTVLSAVFIYRYLKVNNGSAGGTYVVPGLVYLSAGTIKSRGEGWEEFLVRALHHEISSQLLFRHRPLFDEQAFRSHLPEGFVYEDDRPGADTFDVHKDLPGVESLQDLADGFLTDVASRNLEQDFNAYAEILLWRPELFEQFAPDSRVAQKAAIVRNFYISISEQFRSMLDPR